MWLSSLTREQRQRLTALREARKLIQRNGKDPNPEAIEEMAQFILKGRPLKLL